MWSASIASISHANGGLLVEVEYTNGTDSFKEPVQISSTGQTKAWFRTMVKNRIALLNNYDNIIANTIVGEPILPAEDPVTTPEETAKQAYQDKVELYRHMLKAVEWGLFTGTEPQIANTKQWLIDNFQNEYITMF